MKKRFSEQQIVAILKEEEAGILAKEICRKRRHGIAVARQPLRLSSGANQVWTMDFVMDSLANGRRLKILTVVDDFTKESGLIEPAHSLTGDDVAELLDRVSQFRGYPEAVRTDQGPEFTSKVFDQWA